LARKRNAKTKQKKKIQKTMHLRGKEKGISKTESPCPSKGKIEGAKRRNTKKRGLKRGFHRNSVVKLRREVSKGG